MNDLQIFNNPEFGELRTFTDPDGTMLFCGNDIAESLGYARPRDAIKRHCKGAVKRRFLTSSGTQEMNFIPKGDIYRLAARSQLPTADKFESWIFDDIVPSVMETGQYIVPKASPNELILMMAQSNIELEKKVSAIEQKLDNALQVFSSPSKDHWKDDIEDSINSMVDEYRLSPIAFRGLLYKEIERTDVRLQSRLSRLRTRLRKQGITYKDCRALTKLDVISQDKQLKSIFEGVVKKYQAIYSTKIN